MFHGQRSQECASTLQIGNSMYVNWISVQVICLKNELDFQISTAPQHFESDLWLYNFSDWERHKRNKIEHVSPYNRWQPVYSKWHLYMNCCTNNTAVKLVHNTLWCGSVPGTATKLQIYLNCGSVLGRGNISPSASVLTRSRGPSATLSTRTGGSFTGNYEAVARSWPLTCI
jgi:hypothetical protein